MYCRNVRRGYWINVGKMTLFLIVALLLGLALEPPVPQAESYDREE